MRSRRWIPLLAFLLPFAAAAEVERIEIRHREVVAGGRSFGLAGPYEKLVGRVHLALDPAHPGNAAIVDLERAPRGDDGRVRFAADLYLLRPVAPAKGNGALLLEVPNRGGKAAVFYFNRNAARTLDPTAPEDFGDGFLLDRGFTLAWVGWQNDVPEREGLLRLDAVPVLGDGGEPVTGLARADHVFEEESRVLPLGHRDHRPYPVADEDDPRNLLTVREERLGPRRVIPRQRWRFARLTEDGRVVPDRGHVYLAEGFRPGKIYELVYVAGEPTVVGLGLATVRDVASYLKHHPDSPVAVSRVLALGISQTGRFLRHFLYQGFNADLAGRPALDGVFAHTAGAGRGSFNHRFAQPSRDAHPFSAFFYPTDLFPFTTTVQEDPETGLADGLLETLAATPAAVPKIFFTNTGYEYWGRAAALIHTGVDGRRDLPPEESVRLYHLAAAQHFVDRFPPEPRATRHPANPLEFLWALRALLVALDAWVADGTAPPASRVPALAEGTLVAPSALAFPAIPGVEVPRRPHQAYRADYGPRFRTAGLVDLEPPRLGAPFPALVPQADADGNELGGLRLPEVAAPLATYTPWNFRAGEIGAPGELADFRGSFLPFAVTAGDRAATGDPRPSIEERYASRAEYLGRYAEEALALIEGRYLLAEDLPGMLGHAGELWRLVVGERRLRAIRKPASSKRASGSSARRRDEDSSASGVRNEPPRSTRRPGPAASSSSPPPPGG